MFVLENYISFLPSKSEQEKKKLYLTRVLLTNARELQAQRIFAWWHIVKLPICQSMTCCYWGVLFKWDFFYLIRIKVQNETTAHLKLGGLWRGSNWRTAEQVKSSKEESPGTHLQESRGHGGSQPSGIHTVVPSPPWGACRQFASHEVSYVGK